MRKDQPYKKVPWVSITHGTFDTDTRAPKRAYSIGLKGFDFCNNLETGRKLLKQK